MEGGECCRGDEGSKKKNYLYCFLFVYNENISHKLNFQNVPILDITFLKTGSETHTLSIYYILEAGRCFLNLHNNPTE